MPRASDTNKKRRKRLPFEKYTVLNYRGKFHGGFLERLSFMCLMQGSLNQESVSTHLLSSSTVSSDSNMEIQCPESPGKAHLGRALLLSPTQLATEKSIGHQYCHKSKHVEEHGHELCHSFKSKYVQVLSVAKMQKKKKGKRKSLM